MKYYLILLLVCVLIFDTRNPALAQYPRIPPALEDSQNTEMKKFQQLSDDAWAKALPIVESEAKKGKPFIPWAEKPSDLPQAKIPAFPGAEGGGAFSFGGRGGKVIVVTSLEDRGPGTLREACEEGGARIIVFNVAGIIKLKSPINIRAPYVSIEGQTAPGDGVCVAGESVLIDTHDVVMRFMRFRRGATAVTRRDDALGGNPVGNIMIDHVSGSWGLDEVMSIYRHVYNRKGKAEKMPTVNVTMQNCIYAEGLDVWNHSFGSTLGGLNSTFIRSLWANNIARNPSVGMYGDFGFVNNVVFNWWNRSVDGGDNNSFFNFMNNYYKPGPITPKDKPIGYRILKPESGRAKKDSATFGKVYVSGNIMEGNDRVTKDNWDGGVQVGDLPDAGKYKDVMKVDQPFPIAKLTMIPTTEAYKYVLDNAGATLPRRDAVDKRIVEDVRTGKITYSQDAKPAPVSPLIKRRLPPDSYKQGIISDISQVGGYPEYKGTPYIDSDGDGMPDDYEIKHGLDPKNPKDASQYRKDGYTNIEEYLNSVVKISQVRPSSK